MIAQIFGGTFREGVCIHVDQMEHWRMRQQPPHIHDYASLIYWLHRCYGLGVKGSLGVGENAGLRLS